jgi:hypothetical protein
MAGDAMEGYVSSEFWCQLDSLRFVVERNPGSIVILVGIAGFLFWRIQAILAHIYFWFIGHTRVGKWAREAFEVCKRMPTEDKQNDCLLDLRDELRRKVWLFFEWILNIVAVALLGLSAVIVYLILSPPISCAAKDQNSIYIPAVFKLLYNKDGELLYVDETNRSYVRVWPGKKGDGLSFNQTTGNLMTRFNNKVADAVLHAESKTVDLQAGPKEGRDYFVVSWRDRDSFDVYYVSRLIKRPDGQSYIDSLEISSPVHGNALMSLDYKIMFCSFVKPSVSGSMPDECNRF